MANINSQHIFTKRINIRQMQDLILFGARNNQPVFFFGGAGLGKSAKVQEVADLLFPNSERNVCDVRFSGKEASDIEGVPFVMETTDKDGKKKLQTVYVTPSFWPTDPDWRGIVFLDELTNADAHTQHLGYQIMWDKKIGEFEFPKGAIFVGAGNRPGDNGATTEILGPLINRMTVGEVDYNAQIWIEDYAIPHMVHPSIIGFIKRNPEFIYTGHLVDQGVAGHEGPSFSSPRQLVKAGLALDDFDAKLLDDDLLEVVIQGTVGSSLTTAIPEYHKRSKTLPEAVDVLSGKILTYPTPIPAGSPDLVFVFVQNMQRQLLVEAMDHDNIPDSVFVERMARFLDFLYTNHYETHKDMLIAITMNLLRPVNRKQVPLTKVNPARGDNIQNLLSAKSTHLKDIVKVYMKDFEPLMNAFNKKV